MKDGGEPVHTLFKHRLQRVGCYIATGKAGTACGDDNLYRIIFGPVVDDRLNRFNIILANLAVCQFMTCRFQSSDKRAAGPVFFDRARV